MKLLNILNLEWDEEGRVCLETFRAIRDQLSSELSQPIDPAAILKEHEDRPAFPSHDIIIAEVCCTRCVALSYYVTLIRFLTMNY
jgi:hypothetical protein